MKNLSVCLAALLVALGGCAPGWCQERCPRFKEQLVRDFGVKEGSIDCNDAKWAAPRDCPECDAFLQANYGVRMTACDSAPEYLEPRSP